MRILTHKDISFEKKEGGFVNATVDGKDVFEKVHCVPLFPLSDKENYISILYKKENADEEIGIIQKLKEFPKQQQELVTEEVQFRYFIPEIIDIERIYSRFRMHEWTVNTERGRKVFTLMNMRENFLVTDDGIVLVTDIEGCRYKITNPRNLPPRAKAELDKIML